MPSTWLTPIDKRVLTALFLILFLSTCGATDDEKVLSVPDGTRVTISMCSEPRRATPPFTPNSTGLDECASDADCDEDESGRCRLVDALDPLRKCSYHECSTDADCEAGYVCECGAKGDAFKPRSIGVWDNNRCVVADCLTNEDCGGFYCAPQYGGCGSQIVSGYRCSGRDDTCGSHADCAGEGIVCNYTDNETFACLPAEGCDE